jgi:hypothetical protein
MMIIKNGWYGQLLKCGGSFRLDFLGRLKALEKKSRIWTLLNLAVEKMDPV